MAIALFVLIYTVIGLEATQVYHIMTNHNSVRLLYTLQGVDDTRIKKGVKTCKPILLIEENGKKDTKTRRRKLAN